MTGYQKLTAVLATFFAVLAIAPGAAAQEVPADEAALLDQYAEAIPTASGPKHTGGGSGGGETQAVPLPAPVAASLPKAVPEREADRLRDVATSPRLGAPTAALHPPDDGGFTVPEDESAVSAAVNALSNSESGSLGVLYLLLALIAGGMLGAAALQRRKRSNPPIAS